MPEVAAPSRTPSGALTRLASCRPHAAIESWLGAEGAEILLIIHQSHLYPFADGAGGAPVPVGSHAGAGVRSGRPVEEDDHVLPLIVYGSARGSSPYGCRPAPPPARKTWRPSLPAWPGPSGWPRLTDIYRKSGGAGASPSPPSCSGSCSRAGFVSPRVLPGWPAGPAYTVPARVSTGPFPGTT